VVSPGEPFHVREGEPLRDWLMNWYHVRESGVPLFGVLPKEIVPPITYDEFIQSVRDYGVALSRSVQDVKAPRGQAYSVLTLCRALHAHRTGKHASKEEAALWAQEEFLSGRKSSWVLWHGTETEPVMLPNSPRQSASQASPVSSFSAEAPCRVS